MGDVKTNYNNVTYSGTLGVAIPMKELNNQTINFSTVASTLIHLLEVKNPSKNTFSLFNSNFDSRILSGAKNVS